MSSNVEFVSFAVGLAIAAPTLHNLLRRRRGDRSATNRSLAQDLSIAVPFMTCAALSITYYRLHWLWYVAIAIAVAASVRQLLALRQARKRVRNKIDR